MRYGAGSTVLVDGITPNAKLTLFGINGAVALFRFAVYHLKTAIFKAEIGTSAEITVEFFHVMALFFLGVQKTKVWLIFYHIFKVEIVNYLFLVESSSKQFLHDGFVFVSEVVVPLLVSHDFSPKDLRKK